MERVKNGQEIIMKDFLDNSIEIYAFELLILSKNDENSNTSATNTIISVHRKFVGF